ncbi:ABC transporter permease [bacterium]|nr:ABC transporter permease [bacterium]
MINLKAFSGRIWAVWVKEFIQMRRDRLTFGMMFGIPIMQLILFGYAINTDPKHLPTAVHVEEQTHIVRSILQALETSGYYDIISQTSDPSESQRMMASGEVAFVVTIPAGFTEQLVRGEVPQILIEADASDPSASSNAIARAGAIIRSALRNEFNGSLSYLKPKPDPYQVVVHALYNPEGITSYNIVPGLLGVILTLTLVMITSIAMTREAERGTIENLLAMPAQPLEVMIGKITPYVMVGIIQTGVILLASRVLFGVPFVGQRWVLLFGVAVFVVANLAIGFTFSTIAKTQMQAMQLTFFFFLPSMLLSGFMFPFRGMPSWAQHIGEALPLTHFLRLVRGVMLKGATLPEVQTPIFAMGTIAIVVSIVAMLRYRKTLD